MALKPKRTDPRPDAEPRKHPIVPSGDLLTLASQLVAERVGFEPTKGL